MKKLLCVLLTLCIVLSVCSCAFDKKTAEISMYVGLGATGNDYYKRLHELIYDNLGIDVKFVYNNSADTTNAMVNKLQNNDLPADIIITAQGINGEIQKNAFLDLSKYTNVTDLFNLTTVRSATVDGGVYQLPFASRLIGIEYNKTLFAEMGWEVPSTYDEMKELKVKAEAAGYKFAVTGGIATGHGINYLMYVMGTNFLNTPDGAQWLEDFRSGKADITKFADQIGYFSEYVEAGLFGDFHDTSWNPKYEFAQERALFYYNILNDIYTYDGFRYTHDGRLYGVTYDADGNAEAVADDNGNAVLIDGKYEYYNENDDRHKGQQRYTVTGAVVLHDEYGSMPWLSENGTLNCYATYNNIYIALDKALANDDDKLDLAVKILEFMTKRQATSLYDEFCIDGYSSAASYNMDSSRLYSEFAKQINKGYLMDWYYEELDTDTIVFVGEKVNEYIKSGGTIDVSTVVYEFALRTDNYVNGQIEVLATASNDFTYRQTAELLTAVNGVALQAALDTAGIDETVTASLLPYAENLSELPLYSSTPVVQEKIYKGALEESKINSYITSGCDTPVAIRLTGAELSALKNEGFKYVSRDGTEYQFKYCLTLKSDAKLDENAEYIVAIPKKVLTAERYSEYESAGKIITDGKNPVTGSYTEGIKLYTSQYTILNPDNVEW